VSCEPALLVLVLLLLLLLGDTVGDVVVDADRGGVVLLLLLLWLLLLPAGVVVAMIRHRFDGNKPTRPLNSAFHQPLSLVSYSTNTSPAANDSSFADRALKSYSATAFVPSRTMSNQIISTCNTTMMAISNNQRPTTSQPSSSTITTSSSFRSSSSSSGVSTHTNFWLVLHLLSQ
jgi:hypothetical protein